jgi:hypothetical protein
VAKAKHRLKTVVYTVTKGIKASKGMWMKIFTVKETPKYTRARRATEPRTSSC